MHRLPPHHSTFVLGPYRLRKPATVFFLSFAREELACLDQRELSFANLTREKRDLLELFLILTYNAAGHVLAVHHEPKLIDEQSTRLTPFLRCNLSVGVTLLFLVYNNVGGASAPYVPDDDLDAETGAFVDRLLASNDAFVQTSLAQQLKKIVCYKLGLVSFKRLLLLCGNETSFVDLFSHVHWFHNKVLPTVPLKEVKAYGGSVAANEFYRGTPNATCMSDGFGLQSLRMSINKYFNLRCDEDEDEDMEGAHDEAATQLFVALLMQFAVKNVTACALVERHVGKYPEAPFSRWCAGLRSAPLDQLEFTPDMLVFRYELSHLFTPDNPTKYAECYLYRYPRLQNQVSNAPEQWVSALLGDPDVYGPKEDAVAAEGPVHHSVIFPQFANLRELLAAVQHSASAHRLLYNALMSNSITQHHTAPLYRSMIARVGQETPMTAFHVPGFLGADPKETFCASMTNLFVRHFGLCRIEQAVTTFLYVIANTSIRWHTNRIMIVNCAPPGVGKSFINDLIKILFSEAELMHAIARFTPTSFSYTNDPRVGITVVIDDAGFGSDAIKQGANENTNTACSFKNILDKSVLPTMIPQKTGKGQKLVTNVQVAVHNTGFVWNSNSYSVYTEAMMDRAVIFAKEVPVKRSAGASLKFYSASDTYVLSLCKRLGLTDFAIKCLHRQHLFQTAVGLLSPSSFDVKPQYDIVLASAVELYNRRYPYTESAGANQHEGTYRVTTTLLHLAFQKSAFLACQFVWDNWVPEWCASGDLETERRRAMAMLGFREVMAECVAVYHLAFASCLIESVHLVLGYAATCALKTAKDVLHYAFVLAGGVYERLSQRVLKIDLDDPPFHLAKASCKPALAKLTQVKIPVKRGDVYESEPLFKECKSVVAGASVQGHTFLLSDESLLGQMCLFWNRELLDLWSRMADQCGDFPDRGVQITLDALSEVEIALLCAAGAVARLSIRLHDTPSEHGCTLEANPLTAGLRVARVCKLVEEGETFEMACMQIDSEVPFPTDDERDMIREHGSRISLGLTQLTTTPNTTVDIHAEEFSSGFWGKLTVVDECTLRTANVMHRPAMPPVKTPDHESEIAQEILADTLTPRGNGRFVLKKGWEYTLAAREWLLYLFPNDPPSAEKIQRVAQDMRTRYANVNLDKAIYETYGYVPEPFAATAPEPRPAQAPQAPRRPARKRSYETAMQEKLVALDRFFDDTHTKPLPYSAFSYETDSE